MKQNRNFVPIAVTALLLIVSSIGMELLFARYMYLPLFFFARLIMLLTLGTVIAGLFSLIPPPREGREDRFAEGEGTNGGFLALLRRGFSAITHFFRRAGWAVSDFVRRRALLLELVLLGALFVTEQIRFIPSLRRFTDAAQVGYGTVLALLIGSFVCIILDKWCLFAYQAVSAEAEGASRAVLHNLRLTLKLSRVLSLIIAAMSVLRLTALFDGQRWLCYGLIAVWGYCSLFLLISLVSRTIRRELKTNPRFVIPLPFAGREEDDDMRILAHLEANTGITFRSLWSLKYVKRILPYTVLLTVLFFWLATGIVQINTYEQGARYRFGRLEADDILEPGLHLTLPWPLDRVEVYDTGHVRELTVGYEADRQSDNLWTEEHGSYEYRLLLGEGNELVSINMRLEYVIDDLWQYITTSSDPASLLRAAAYELIIDRTISVDLDTLLSVDRTAFAQAFREELNSMLKENPIGLSVIRVAVESIHPPVEVAAVYQLVVSAELEAEALLWEAEAMANVARASAEAEYDTLVQTAEADYHTRVAAAHAEVTEFMAAVSADTSHRDAYRYYKYLNALQTSLRGSRLYLLGPDIDADSLYLGGSYVIVGSGQ